MAAVGGAVGDAILLLDGVIRGHHIYKSIWTPVVGDILCVNEETSNEHDDFAVCVRKEGTIVGHVPVEYSRIFYFFLLHNGRISCEVIGHQKHGKGLEVPCRYTLTGTEKMVVKLKDIIRKKETAHTS